MRTWLWTRLLRLIPDDLFDVEWPDDTPAVDGDGWIFCAPAPEQETT